MNNVMTGAADSNEIVWYDTAVIGGGILGCFAARNLMRWKLSVVLLEAEDDICKGITRANTAIVYTGCDNKPGSLKARLTVQGNRNFAQLCANLDVPFSRCGSLLVTFDEQAEHVLHKKYEMGIRNGVQGMQLLTGTQVRELEPMISENVIAGLYVPDTGTVNPWQLGIAACENAINNGCQLLRNEKVRNIQRINEGYLVETTNKKIYAKSLVNCAGNDADVIHGMLFEQEVYIEPDATDYLVMDSAVIKPQHIIFQETRTGKGITAVPCTEGNLLVESVSRTLTEPFATTREGLEIAQKNLKEILPQVDSANVIRSFGAVRPNLCGVNGENISDFYIGNPVPSFFSLIGVKTPGLTCANELGMYIAEKIAHCLSAETNPAFDPIRKRITRTDTQIVCQCEQITKSEIIEAIKRGAVTVDGVKRRVGAGMGRCQGSRCAYAIERLLEEESHGTV